MSTGKLRREQILKLIREADQPISATTLSKHFSVSRQVIVGDIALLRAADHQITSTIRGYEITGEKVFRRTYKVIHSEADAKRELQIMVDCGGTVVEVFVNHRVYGVIRTRMNIQSRRDIDHLIDEIDRGNSDYLMHMTSGFHFHTVEAPAREILDLIASKLEEEGFSAPVREYEAHLLEDPESSG